MKQGIVRSHVREGSYRRSLYLSMAGHLVLLLFFTVGVSLLPPPEAIHIGSGTGGGQAGDYVTVDLAADLGGGEGRYKPALTAARLAVTPPPPPLEPEASQQEEETPDEEVFVEKATKKKAPTQKETPPPAKVEQKPAVSPPTPAPPASDTSKQPATAENGQIPRKPDPGVGGPGSAGGGAGGSMGGGQGVLVGGGSGEGQIDSWYVRQVERRIGQNWLKTSLGELQGQVESIVSFEVQSGGQIVNVQYEKRSGIGSVDLAVQRALEASNPLPPLPYELRKRTVRFRAIFQYPPARGKVSE